MKMLEIDEVGLNEQDRKLLQTLWKTFSGGPVGLGTLSASLSEEEDTVENVIEPYLLQLGFIERTPRGRIISEKGIEHLENSKI
jgi:Holliday junction DNA helicase RuvB